MATRTELSDCAIHEATIREFCCLAIVPKSSDRFHDPAAHNSDKIASIRCRRSKSVGRHIPNFVSCVHRIAIELINPEETEIIMRDRAAWQAWLEARGYRVVSMATASVEGNLAAELERLESSLLARP